MKTTTVWMLCVVVVTTSALPLGKQQKPDQIDEIQESQDMSDMRSPDQGDGQPNPPSPDRATRHHPTPPESKPVGEARQPQNPPGPDRGHVRESDSKQPDPKPVAGTWLNRRRPNNSRPADKLPPMGYMQRMISHVRDSIDERFRRPGEEARKPPTGSKVRPMLPDSDTSRSSGTEEGGEKRAKPKVLDGERAKEEGAKRLESSEHWRGMISNMIRLTFVKPKVGDDERAKSGEESRRPKSSEPEHFKLQARHAVKQPSNPEVRPESGDGSKRTEERSWPKPVRVASTEDARSDRAQSGEGFKRPKSSEPEHFKLQARDAVKQTSNPEVRPVKKTESGDASKRTEERSGPKPVRVASTKDARSVWAKRPGSSEPEEFKLKAHHDVKDSTKPGVRDGKTQARASGGQKDRERGSLPYERREDSFASGHSGQSRHSRKSSR